MAGITTTDVVVGFKKGATWGTEVQVTSTNAFKLYVSQVSISGGPEEFLSRDTGFTRKMTETVRLTENYQITLTGDLTFDQPWIGLLASVLGTESSASETTPAQGDYLRTIDLADATFGASAIFWTLAWTIEDSSKLIVCPSVKFNSLTIQAEANNVGTWTLRGVVDRPLHTGATTTHANLAALSATANYQASVLGGANAYFRQNASSGGSLSGSDNKEIEYYSIELTRPIRPQHVLRTSSSAFIIEPKEIDRIDGFVTVRYGAITASSQDLLDHWRNKTAQKAELYFDGAQVGSGTNVSFKFQFPLLEATPEFPQGHDVPNNNSLMTPTIRYRMLKRSAAPTGMTGVTDYLRVTSTDRRSTKWTA